MLWILYVLLTPPTLILFVQLCMPRTNGLGATWHAGKRLFLTEGGRLILVTAVAVALVNALQCLVDPGFSDALGYDLTALVRRFEGDFVEQIQAILPAALEPFFTWIYIAGYIAFLLLPLVVFSHLGRRRQAAGYLSGFVANYLAALPFYFFVPVQEVAWSGLSEARPLMENVLPGISDAMRVGSALDNCFPSLHVSCSTTVLWAALRHGGAAFKVTATVVWVLIGYSVLALGVHWGVDVLFGIPFGMACAAAGERWAAPRFGD